MMELGRVRMSRSKVKGQGHRVQKRKTAEWSRWQRRRRPAV